MNLPLELRARLCEWAQLAYPRETCGLLLGRRGSEGSCHIEHTMLARNLCMARARDRYELDPSSFVAADDEARSHGLDIVGVWHTHPDHPAEPSETDRGAAWEGWSYLIISVGPHGAAEVRSWRLSNERFEEEQVTP